MGTHIRAKNFKSSEDSDKVELAPLTGFFGTNSSGKSSLLQMLLLLKQTVEHPDPDEVIFFGLNESQAPMFRGEEGSIWYVRLKDTPEIRMYKCKPHRIEQVHWTQAQTQLSSTVIWTTLLKAFENWENPGLNEVIAILNEDYPIHQITVSIERIEQMLNTAKNAANTRKKIWELMVMQGFDGNTDIAIVSHKIANELDQDKRLIYKTIKNVQNMMKIEDE